jgi:hypothetical protein
VFAAQTLIAQDILGGDNNNNDFGIGSGDSNQSAAFPTKTNDVQLLGAKPTWSEVAEDPAATVGDVWAQEIQDAQNVDNNAADNQANADAAAAEKQALDEAKAAEEAAAQEAAPAEEEAAPAPPAEEEAAPAPPAEEEAAPAPPAEGEAAPAKYI